jgi:hypothetical protein
MYISDSIKMVGRWWIDGDEKVLGMFNQNGSVAFFWIDSTMQDKVFDDNGVACHGYQFVSGPKQGQWMSFTYEEALEFKTHLDNTK